MQQTEIFKILIDSTFIRTSKDYYYHFKVAKEMKRNKYRTEFYDPFIEDFMQMFSWCKMVTLFCWLFYTFLQKKILVTWWHFKLWADKKKRNQSKMLYPKVRIWQKWYRFGCLTYSDISNNRTGTAIYFHTKILPIRSY